MQRKYSKRCHMGLQMHITTFLGHIYMYFSVSYIWCCAPWINLMHVLPSCIIIFSLKWLPWLPIQVVLYLIAVWHVFWFIFYFVKAKWAFLIDGIYKYLVDLLTWLIVHMKYNTPYHLKACMLWFGCKSINNVLYNIIWYIKINVPWFLIWSMHASCIATSQSSETDHLYGLIYNRW